VSDPDLSLHEAAELLGVHYMTAYRYVRLGLLPATKSGGSWQVARADLDAFRAAGDGGGGAGGSSKGADNAGEAVGRRRAPWADRLESRLVAGDGRGAWGVIEAALAAGAEIDEVYLDIISPAMRSIGARWEAGELDVSVEHRATGIAFRLLGRLGPRFVRRGRTRGVIVLGTPRGEHHSLPVAMVADLLRGDGWEVSDLGADLPTESFVVAVQATESLVAVGVSVTSTDNLEAAAELIAALRLVLANDVLIVVGGHAVADADHAVALGADSWASSARDFVAQMNTGADRHRTA